MTKAKKSTEKGYDHWHQDGTDRGRPYRYMNAAKLLEDFWKEVDKMQKRLERAINEYETV